ncbi:hypothetical protein DSM3645_03193 [Blastopirellula marina DSM 3645]|uniref:Uncharacterized protein n=1 Tax=Blastopirellula marina DSM 3645 TaxID=314230 RepID=A3ZVV2_9BACT|nr:hypothetical protein DSM3645_03193 [Blastopirellula marina DSM 3645]
MRTANSLDSMPHSSMRAADILGTP